MSDPVKIKPIAPSFAQSEPPLTPKRKRSFPWALAFIPVILMIAFALFKYVPTHTVAPINQTRSDAKAESSAQQPEISIDAPILPYREVELQRAQERATSTLYAFGRLQDKVEFEQLGLAEYQSDYDAIIDAANAADASFAARKYETALDQYEDATKRLGEYVLNRESAFEQAYATGYHALVARDLNMAKDSLNRAAKLKPNDEALTKALNRLAKLPAVNRLVRESQRAVLRSEYDVAAAALVEAKTLDPETTGLDTQLSELRFVQNESDYKQIMTVAYATLNRDELQAAKQAFEHALRLRPDDKAATAGIQEVATRLESATLVNLKRKAETLERDGDLRAALQTYRQALEIDGNLQFARDGQLRTEKTVRLLAAIDRVLGDPDMLSTNSEYEEAKRTLAEAREYEPVQRIYAAEVKRLAKIITTASKPLPIVLVSDNAMEVRLATVGDLGPFGRKELSLRPGRYVITGSANGCRDVRKTIVVSEDMEPIAIVCNEPI